MHKKYATMQILGYRIAGNGQNSLMRTAHRVAFNYTPQPGFLYVRSRMISSRCNDNFDEFPSEEIEKGYLSFVGKPVFVNHHNDDHRRARGVIIDVALHKDANRDGTPDTWVEGLMEIDALSFPKLAGAIVRGDIARTSMGVDVAFSVCAACGNKATTPLEYCRHIPGQKGAKIMRRTASGESVPTLIRERCHGLRFFENSLLVEDPADPTAYFLGDVERGPGLEHLGAKIASAPPFIIPESMTRQAVPDFRAVAEQRRSQTLNRIASRSLVNASAQPRTAALRFVAAGACPACRGNNTITVQGSFQADCWDCGTGYDLRTIAASSYSYDTRKNPGWVSNPGSHPIWKDMGAHVDNIVKMYDQASKGEHTDGMRWYHDAHLLAHHIGNSTGIGTHKMAGLLSAYSPQMGWHANLHHAVRSAHLGRAIGPGEGSTVMASHQKAAQRILDGEDHQSVLKGPKTNAFAHNIEHGGLDPETGEHSPRVTVDVHAASVMCGRRLKGQDKIDMGNALGKANFYPHAQHLYQEAAAHVSGRDGIKVAPHQMQAITWGVQKRINDASPEQNKGVLTVERNNQEKWRGYHQETPSSGLWTPQSREPGLPNLHSSRGRRGR